MELEEPVTLRPRRQMTLPRGICEELGLTEGDHLILEVHEGVLIGRPAKAVALEALDAFRRAIKESGVTEEELLESGRQIREELFLEKYGHLFEEEQGTKRSRRRSA